MKAVMLGLAPAVRFVDVSHDVPPQDITAGSLLLESAYEAFPAGSLFLCVIDPGVGSNRIPMVARAGAHLFVAPDNGLLTPILERFQDVCARRIRNPLLLRDTLSATFHGRDLFAVTAARLAMDFPFERVGPLIPRPVRLSLSRSVAAEGRISGEIVAIDRFGNAASNIRDVDLRELPSGVRVSVDGVEFGPLRQYYAEVELGERIALVNSAGRLEVAVNGGSAAEAGVGKGSLIVVK